MALPSLPHFEESDPRESSSGNIYKFGIGADGRLACNCRGWTTKKPGKARECKHTKRLITKFGLVVYTTTQGDYQYVTVGQYVASAATKTKLVPQVTAATLPVVATHEDIKSDGRKRFKTFGVATEAEQDVAPMLAEKMPNLPDEKIESVLKEIKRTYSDGGYVMEEKFDGHRVVVAKYADGTVRARSRTGKLRTLPRHIEQVFLSGGFPQGTYDGEEYIPGGVSTDVTDLKNAGKQVFVVFDILTMLGNDVTGRPLHERRAFLEKIFEYAGDTSAVVLAEQALPSADFVKKIWERAGEGAIIKRIDGRYFPGKRTREFIKVKGLETALVEVTGFESGKLGPHAVVLLKNVRDNSVAKVASMGGSAKLLKAFNSNPQSFIGRRAYIEYQFRTKDGSYRHPRWDRWENE